MTKKRLISTGLFGKGLVGITGTLLERYNDCLLDIGVAPTKLDRITVDGMGYSAEVARERGDDFYLSGGPANPVAVIVTPMQSSAPVTFPFHSFERFLIQEVYTTFARQIADITEQDAIWLDFDDDISQYRNPLDLLMVGKVVVCAHTPGGTIPAAKEQHGLVHRFLEEEHAWEDPGLRAKIMASAKKSGDLRYRSIIMDNLPFADVRNFYTHAFHGVWVFRDIRQDGIKALMVIRDQKLAEETAAMAHDDVLVKSIDAPDLAETLISCDLAHVDLAHYAKYPELVMQKRDFVEADILCAAHPRMKFEGKAKPARNRMLMTLGDEATRFLLELERLAKQASDGIGFLELSPEARLALLHPAFGQAEPLKRVVWQLLVELWPHDAIQLYRFNKSLFYKAYERWPTSKKEWAAKLIKERYVNRKGVYEDGYQ